MFTKKNHYEQGLGGCLATALYSGCLPYSDSITNMQPLKRGRINLWAASAPPFD
jgi:hypothetical protein